MTPASFTNLQIVNATARPLVLGNNPPQGVPAFNAYQMAAWFNFPGAPPSPLVPARASISYTIQALQGVGDEDDAANLLVNLNDPSNASANVFYLYAGSFPDSAHYVQAVPLAPASSLVVVGASVAGQLQTATASTVQWFATFAGLPPIFLGVMPNAAQALVVADLAVLFPKPQAVSLFAEIVTRSLPAADQQSLYDTVTSFVA